AIADIVSAKQIVNLNDRLNNLSVTLNDQNLQVIDKHRLQLKAKAKLSDDLAGTDPAQVEQEILEAGMRDNAMDEFSRLLAESELKDKERGVGGGPEIERTM